jgi:hypothetical protein
LKELLAEAVAGVDGHAPDCGSPSASVK